MTGGHWLGAILYQSESISFNSTYPEDLKPHIESVFGLVTMERGRERERESERARERERDIDRETECQFGGVFIVGCRRLLPF